MKAYFGLATRVYELVLALWDILDSWLISPAPQTKKNVRLTQSQQRCHQTKSSKNGNQNVTNDWRYTQNKALL